jgi:hypothetical protein
MVEASKQGQAVVDAHFAARGAGDLDAVIALYGGPALEHISAAEWREMLLDRERTIGRLLDRTLLRWEVSLDDEGWGPGTYTKLDYRVQYAKQTVDERFLVFAPAGDGVPLIGGHHVDP